MGLVGVTRRPEAHERSSLTDPGLIFYRIIRSRQAELDDFKSAKSLGKPLRDRAHLREWERGVSVFATLDYARERARAFRFALGRFVVAIRVPEDGGAEPERLLSLVDGDAVRVEEK